MWLGSIGCGRCMTPQIGFKIAAAILALPLVLSFSLGKDLHAASRCSGEEIAALMGSGATYEQLCQICGGDSCARQSQRGGISGPYATQRRAYEVAEELGMRGYNCNVRTEGFSGSSEYYVDCY
jgi:hypothetical protein